MAGLLDTIDRMIELVGASLPGFSYSKQDVASLIDAMPSGFDKTYSVGGVPVCERQNPVSSNITQTRHQVDIEIAREFSGGTSMGYDSLSIYKDLEASAFAVSENIDYPNNWDYTNTGLILLTIEPDSGFEVSDYAIVYRLVTNVTIRRNSTHSEVL